MKVRVYSDPIDMEELANSIESPGIAVLGTTTPQVISKIKERFEGEATVLACKAKDDASHSYIYAKSIKPPQAQSIATAAMDMWIDEDYENPFTAEVDE